MGQLIELGSCLYAVIGASIVAWGIWRAWSRPKDREVVRSVELRSAPVRWSVRGELARLFLVQDNAGDSVNHSQPLMSPDQSPPAQTTQTDGQTDDASAADQWVGRLQLDRSKTALIELMVYSGWSVAEIRAVVKGDNGAIGQEIEAARKRLGMAPSEGYRTPVAGRSTDAKFQDALN